MTAPPSFAAWHRALHGYDPFPWQEKCAEELRAGRVRHVAVPTGCGKSTVMDAAVWACGVDALSPPSERVVPTRIWWITPRRALVDEASERARGIAAALLEGEKEAARTLAKLLRLRSDAEMPLEVLSLRGGLPPERRDPILPSSAAQPAVIVSTVPMFGSRLLFRGYGTRPLARPMAAAMAGTDSLVICDEAHLVEALRTLLSEVSEHDAEARQVLPGTRSLPTVISVTATGATEGLDESVLTLGRRDRTNPLIDRRIRADKRLTVENPKSAAPDALARAATGLLASANQPTSCLVYANTPETARLVAELIDERAERAGIAEVHLATGRMRTREADRAARNIKSRIAAGSGELPDAGHVVVVATQTLEVGADLDAEFLVTEACGPRALIQRLGRVNRLGGARVTGRAIWVHTRPGRDKRWPVYGETPAAVYGALVSAEGSDSTVDASPSAISELLDDIPRRETRRPTVTHAQMAAWRKTSVPVDADPPVEPYFSGVDEDVARLRVAWRVHLPKTSALTSSTGEGDDPERVWPAVTDREVIELPLPYANRTVGRWLDGLDGLDPSWVRVRADRTVETCSAQDLRPGETVLISASAGGCDDRGWSPESTAPVIDQTCDEGRITLTKPAIEHLLAEVASADEPAGWVEILKTANDAEADDSVREDAANELIGLLATSLPELETAQARLIGPHWRAAPPRWSDVLKEDDDERSAGSVRLPTLAEHGEEAAEAAQRAAQILGMPPELCAAVAAGARYHDVGKADPRFQACLGATDVLMAKSDAPRHKWPARMAAAGWPKGGRHEALSALALLTSDFVLQDGNDHDLVVHLVASHHGHARPMIRPVLDNTWSAMREIPIDLPEIDPVRVSTDLSMTDWRQPRRFALLNERYGTLGLALLESVVRYADWRVSDTPSGSAGTPEGDS